MNNTLDESSERLVAFRSTVPSPSRARLAAGRDRLLAATRTEAGQTGVRRRAGSGPFLRWRPAVALAAAGGVAAVAVGAGYALTAHAGQAGQPTGMTAVAPRPRTPQVTRQATLAAKVLHDAARVAAKAGTREPSPGQWIFSESVQTGYRYHAAFTSPPEWITFDGGQTAYYQGPDGNGPLVVHTNRTSFPPPGANLWAALITDGISPKIAWDLLDSLPANPQALLAVIAEHAGAGGLAAAGALFGGGKPATKAQTEFDYLTWLMWNAQSGLGGPPSGDFAAYSALATLPGISVQDGITDAAGAPAIGVSADGGHSQLLLSPATYQVIGLRSVSTGVAPKRRRYIGAHGAYPPKGAVILSTAFTQVTEVPAAGDR